ncbi:MAG TPA: alpha/beta fold hydrolase [Thermoanaerobaculia bacterium]|nr:alpha/beta fold hydrolase [Thermoanaerobaculia bacterium]
MKKQALFAVTAVLAATSLLAQAPETKVVEVFSHKISYIEAGSGSPVILLHGMGANKGVWRLTIPALAQKFHVYAPDQIGFGASDKPLINYHVATYSDFLAEFMQTLGITRASIVGNSLGGWVAADFAIRYPDRVDRLVLVDAAGYFTQPVNRKDLEVLNPGTLDETREMVKLVFFNKQMHTEAVVHMLYAERMKAGDAYTIERLLDAAAQRMDMLNDRLASVHAPALVMHGRQDPLIPLAAGQSIAQQIPGSKTVILDDCGHVPEIECPVSFDKALVEFLSGEVK